MSDQIEHIGNESRLFPPSEHFSAQSRVGSFGEYEKLYQDVAKDPEGFWSAFARQNFHWFKDFDETLSWEAPYAKWFDGGQTNLAFNCLDHRIASGDRNKAALITEYEDGRVETLTYGQLLREVCMLAGGLRSRGIEKGDRVGIYMPNAGHAAIAMLACARIGAVHSVVFGGFSAKALADRMNDCDAKCLITADGLRRRGNVVSLKEVSDEAADNSPTLETVVVWKNCGNEVAMKDGRDVWWHELVAGQPAYCSPEKVESEHPLFLLYTSGTTGKPKGIKHTTAGYMAWARFTAGLVFDLQPDDVYFCTADVGWITGHTYVVYGILLNGGTSLMYEGAPTYPEADRFWDMVNRHGVNVFYTAPTAIRAFMKLGEEFPARHDLSSLRLLGTVGEPINPEAWIWYHKNIGGEDCPIVDTYWQTETGGIVISPLPGATSTKPGSATFPLPGIIPEIIDDDGNPVEQGSGGRLIIRQPWPGMTRGIWGDDQRFKDTYFSAGDFYLTGDAAFQDSDGYYWVLGRLDDVVNVSGHRLGTAEVESALVSHAGVAEAAVVSRPDDVTGQALVAFVTLKQGVEVQDSLVGELKEHVATEIGKIARPAEIRFAAALPKTRSGKIMRRLLRDIASGKESTGDTSTLEDYTVLQKLREGDES